MKNTLIIVSLLFTLPLLSQHLNQFGHLISDEAQQIEYSVSATSKGPEILLPDFTLKGNALYRIPTGFLTLSGEDENLNSTVRIYNTNGVELFAKSFIQTINFTLSPSKLYCAFYHGNNVSLIDLNSYFIRSFEGSNTFALNDNGELAYLEKNNRSIHLNGTVYETNEPIYKLLFFKNNLIWISKTKLYTLINDKVTCIFTCNNSRIFDIMANSNKLYFSTKTEAANSFIFKSYSTDDLIYFKKEEESQYLLSGQNSPQEKIKPVKGFKGNMLPNELIRNPLNYFNDTVYQPIGNTNNELQDYGSPYLHPGVDLMGYYLQDVRSVKNGYVKAILTTSGASHWRIAISNEDTDSKSQGYLYAHIENTTFPYAVGDLVSEGDVIGKLVNFPVAGFVHCHFARIVGEGEVWDGNWISIDNPLVYMSNFFDSIPPQFEKTINNDEFAFRDQTGKYLSPDSMYGSVKVISKVFDRLNADWHCDVNQLSYSVSPLENPGIILLDSFAFDFGYSNDFYSNGSYYAKVLNTIYSRDNTCYSASDYEVREFYHIITNSDGNDTIDNNDSKQIFNTLNLKNGSYIFRIKASDPTGNTTVDSMIIKIKNTITEVPNIEVTANISVSPNPFTTSINLKIPDGDLTKAKIIISDLMGKMVYKSDNIRSNQLALDLQHLINGVYILDVEINNTHTLSKIVKI